MVRSRGGWTTKKHTGGGERDRTAGLDVANVALSQLSYTPEWCLIITKRGWGERLANRQENPVATRFCCLLQRALAYLWRQARFYRWGAGPRG